MIDILSDAKRRQQGNSVASPKGQHFIVTSLQELIDCEVQHIYLCLFIPDNVEFILKNMAVRHCSDSQDNDQPDYDSVASDEDTDQELPSSKGDRTKVSGPRFKEL